MLTPEDIQALKEVFATKDDLTRFATKEDLAKFATKDDLTNFATKDDLTALASQKDLQSFRAEMTQMLEATTTAILDGVRSYLEANITPFIPNHEQRLKRIEDHMDLPPNGHN